MRYTIHIIKEKFIIILNQRPKSSSDFDAKKVIEGIKSLKNQYSALFLGQTSNV